MKWSYKNGAWVSGSYHLERQRVPLYLSNGYQEYRYEITRDGLWLAHIIYVDDAKKFAEAHSAQVDAGVQPWPPEGFTD
mgnify:CR=1 FL=1